MPICVVPHFPCNPRGAKNVDYTEPEKETYIGMWKKLAWILAVVMICSTAAAEEPAPARPGETAASRGAKYSAAEGGPSGGKHTGAEELALSGLDSADEKEIDPADAEISLPGGETAGGEVDLSGAEAYDDGERIELPRTKQELLDIVGDIRHILLVGLDARPGEKTGRSDTMILLTLDAEHGAVKLTSFMRDLYVAIPGHGNNRLNAAWVYGGPELLMETIEGNFGVKCREYVAVDFSLLAQVIDDLGGLEIEIETDKQLRAINGVIREDNAVLGLARDDGLLTQAGRQTLTGKQAQAYARYRKHESDFTRTQRQREVIGLLMEKAAELSPLRLGALAVKYAGQADTSLSAADMLKLLPAVLSLRSAGARQLRIPQDGAYANKTINGMAVLVPDLGKARNALGKFLNEG